MSESQVPWEDEVHIEIQLAYARRELDLCQAAERDQPTLTRDAYALMITVKEAVLRTLERVARAERTHRGGARP